MSWFVLRRSSSTESITSKPVSSHAARRSRKNARSVVARNCGVVALTIAAALAVLTPVSSAADGALDGTFGAGGRVFTDFPGGLSSAETAVVQPDGKIVAGGCGGFLTDSAFALVRYQSNGFLDTSFGSAGKVVTEQLGSGGCIEDLALQPDGKIIAVGASSGQLAVARYLPNGALDPSFGNRGITTTDLGGDDSGSAALLQPDGKILVAGYSNNDFALARYNSDGTLDGSFGQNGNGKVITDLGGADHALAAVFDSNQNIVLAGYSDSNFAMARYRPDGQLDTTFGSGGTVITDLGGGESVTSLAVQNDGKLVAVGSSYSTRYDGSGRDDLVAVRYNANGTLDTSFATGGKLLPDLGNPSQAADVVVQPDGKIVIVGELYGDTSRRRDFLIARYEASGAPDLSFGAGQGRVATDLGGSDGANEVVLTGGGRIAAVGSRYRYPNGDTEFALVQYQANGSLDPGFGNSGTVITDVSGVDKALAVARQNDGKIVAVGECQSSSGVDIALARYNPDGSLDRTFGSGGKVVTDLGGTDSTRAVVVQSDGKIVIGTGNGDFVLVRYNSDGTIDSSFGDSGKVVVDLGSADGVNALALQSDGKIVAAGISGGNVAVVRLESSGALDSSFGSGGKVLTDLGASDRANAVTIQRDGKIVAVGVSGNNVALVRYEANGNPDSSFGDGGKVITDLGGSDVANGVAIQPDDKLVVVGQRSAAMAVLRYTTSGALDASFGVGGKVLTTSGNEAGAAATVIQPDGKILVAGYRRTYSPDNSDFALARYNPDGSLDTAFGTAGILVSDLGGRNDRANGAVFQPDGRLVVAGVAGPTGVGNFALARYWVSPAQVPGGSSGSSGAGGTPATGGGGGTTSPGSAPPAGGATGGASGSGGGRSGATGDRTAPRITLFALARRAFAVARSGTPFASRRLRRGVGSAVRVRVSEPARLEFVVYQRVVGRRVGKRCVPKRSRQRKGRRCFQWKAVGRRFSVSVGTAIRELRFTGRVPRAHGRGHVGLRPGRYRLVVRAVDRAGNRSRERGVEFTVRRS